MRIDKIRTMLLAIGGVSALGLLPSGCGNLTEGAPESDVEPRHSSLTINSCTYKVAIALGITCNGCGVGRTTDGGATGSDALSGASTSGYVNRVEWSTGASDPGTVWAATSGGLFKSTDSGAHWSTDPFGTAGDVVR